MKAMDITRRIKGSTAGLKLAGVAGGFVAAASTAQHAFAAAAEYAAKELPGQLLVHTYRETHHYTQKVGKVWSTRTVHHTHVDNVFHYQDTTRQCFAIGQEGSNDQVVRQVGEDICKQVVTDHGAKIDVGKTAEVVDNLAKRVADQGQPPPALFDSTASNLQGMYGIDNGVRIIGEESGKVVRVFTQSIGGDKTKTTCENITDGTRQVFGWDQGCGSYAPGGEQWEHASKWVSDGFSNLFHWGSKDKVADEGIRVHGHIADSFNQAAHGIPDQLAAYASTGADQVTSQSAGLPLEAQVILGGVIAGLCAAAGYFFWRGHRQEQAAHNSLLKSVGGAQP